MCESRRRQRSGNSLRSMLKCMKPRLFSQSPDRYRFCTLKFVYDEDRFPKVAVLIGFKESLVSKAVKWLGHGLR